MAEATAFATKSEESLGVTIRRADSQEPVLQAGIRGTHFSLLFCQTSRCAGIQNAGGRSLDNGLYADIASGSISLTNAAGSVVINAGQFGFVAGPSTLPGIVPPAAGACTMPNAISTSIASRGLGIGVNREDSCVMQKDSSTPREICARSAPRAD